MTMTMKTRTKSMGMSNFGAIMQHSSSALSRRRRHILSLLGLISSFVLLLTLAVLILPCHSFRLPIPKITAKDATWFFPRARRSRLYSHVVPPHNGPLLQSNVTLRDFILHPDGVHLALAPAFFGFFAQFGAMQAWEESMSRPPDFDVLHAQIKSLAGSSAGAMTAVLISCGVPPTTAAAFCQTVTLDKFADPPGVFAIFKGHLFHDIMHKFMRHQSPDHSLQLEDGKIPVAVTAFDLRSMKGKILTAGSMSLAARASASFPVLFQPVTWEGHNDDDQKYYFVDGGIGDTWGLEALAAFPTDKPKRVVHIAVGNYDGRRGPSTMPEGVTVSDIVSISIRNTPKAGPWALENGPKAVEAARLAMLASLDLPLFRGEEPGHYVLHMDTTEFIPN